MSKIVAFITCCDSAPLAKESLYYLKKNSTIAEVVLIDNGSNPPLPKFDADAIMRYEENLGANPVLHSVLKDYPGCKDADIVAFFHCDFMVREEGWDEIVAFAFDNDPKLGLVGFLGSNEIDAAGGRGLGTTSSFMGYEYETIWASKAEIHGKRSRGIEAAAVIDHCSLIFRKSVLEQITPSEEGNHVPHHFYDRILSCEVLNKGYHIATIGLEVDHSGGGTGLAKARTAADVTEAGVIARDILYRKWLDAHGLPSDGDGLDNRVYLEGERLYLSKWRDQLHFIPLKVHSDYSIEHRHREWGANPWLI